MASPTLSPPNAPIILHQEDMEYRLRSSVRIRQAQADTSSPHLRTSVSAITENILDLEVDNKSTVCKITCAEPFTEENWRKFLRGCDFLSGMKASTSKKTRFTDVDNPDITL
ncbi:hypothetical protein BT96DRAFT_245195 [Gymnopus androsaceus JB14]|uniref:Uncharacterized protein n=1 Tax=Gymnopus androsaceus JB14 TaxID=1447944 RepID=A0A6A4IFB0_9AGAR|nr:hypothetical protein BT96DRAFT_245195 [Gymnopus androsaceus JB14]